MSDITYEVAITSSGLSYDFYDPALRSTQAANMRTAIPLLDLIYAMTI